MPGDVFEVVFVCTGNRFRSPLAEALFRHAVEGHAVAVSSRGTLDLGTIPVLPEAEREARRLGIVLSEHRARSLRGADLTGADLIVGFERMHLVTAVMEANAARDRSFTFPELVGLLDKIERPHAGGAVERARQIVARAHTARSDDPALFGHPELADPLGGPPDLFRGTADRVRTLSDRLAAQLFPAPN